jgi:hypothetical protein
MATSAFNFGPMLDAWIGRPTVGFIKVDSGVPNPLGSGTLVRTSTIQGILTCAHVVREIAKESRIGLALFPVSPNRLQMKQVNVSILVPPAITYYDAGTKGLGRDLAFIPLPVQDFASLAAIGTAVDLDLHATRAAEAHPADASPVEAAAGLIGERTPDAEERDGRLVLQVAGLINVGQFIATGTNTSGFDLLELEPRPGEEFESPSTYGGMSGGGMWRVFVRRNSDGGYDMAQSRLVGVTFWETWGTHKHLIGHGPRSVFEQLLREMYQRWR